MLKILNRLAKKFGLALGSITKPKDEYIVKAELSQWHADTILYLTEQQQKLLAQHHIPRPLISIIMPTWNRANMISEAIASVIAQTYQNWELIIIDDGSIDNTKKIIGPYLTDSRIHYYEQPHYGQSQARNLALAKSKGEIIAYLDSDNYWYSYTLIIIATSFIADPSCKIIYFGALDDNFITSVKKIDFRRDFNYEDAIINKKTDVLCGIDLNCFVHHRDLYEQYGGFESNLTRLTDFELAYRYCKHAPCKEIPMIGTYYRFLYAKNTATHRESFFYNLYLIREKYHTPPKRLLRVLYAVGEFPQITETYIDTEIEYMKRQGVQIEVWAVTTPAAPYSTSTPVHYGELKDAIKKFQPNIIHFHWLNITNTFIEEVTQCGIPFTARGHSFDFFPDLLKKLHDETTIRAIYLFEHFKKSFANDLHKAKAVAVNFNPHRYKPAKEKNKRLVLRVSAGLPTRGLASFIKIAVRCKTHQFALVLGQANYKPEYVYELVTINESLGCPVDIYINDTHNHVEALMQEAGIYLHTFLSPEEGGNRYFGMPISICEAMATGAYVIGRYCPDSANYIGSRSQTYTTEDEACALIEETLSWTDEQWREKQIQAVERAYCNFVDDKVLPTVLEDWEKIAVKEHTQKREVCI